MSDVPKAPEVPVLLSDPLTPDSTSCQPTANNATRKNRLVSDRKARHARSNGLV